MIFSDIFQQSLGNLFSNERTLHISRIEDNTVSTDSIANIFVSCLCDASIQYTVKTKRKSNEPWFYQTCISLKRDKYRPCESLELHIRMTIVTRIYEPEIVLNRHARQKKTDYRTMKLDD